MSSLPSRISGALSDHYRLEEEIGAGGMATVYLAQDLRHDRRVAVKVLRPELAAVIGAERFLAEIKLTANLQHPHIEVISRSTLFTGDYLTAGFRDHNYSVSRDGRRFVMLRAVVGTNQAMVRPVALVRPGARRAMRAGNRPGLLVRAGLHPPGGARAGARRYRPCAAATLGRIWPWGAGIETRPISRSPSG